MMCNNFILRVFILIIDKKYNKIAGYQGTKVTNNG